VNHNEIPHVRIGRRHPRFEGCPGANAWRGREHGGRLTAPQSC
jgi:hypothetical protein